MTAPDQWQFDSDELSPDDSFVRYRELYAPGADVVRLSRPFAAKVRAWRLHRGLLFDRRLRGVGHERDAARVQRDAFDHFTLTFVLSGDQAVDTGEGFRQLLPGEALLLDMMLPMRLRSYDAHIVTVSIARDRLAGAAGQLDGLHGAILTGPGAGLLGDYLRALVERIAALSDAAHEPAMTALSALVAVALGKAVDEDPELLAARRATARIERIRALIDARLSDPDFTASEVIATSDLSRATLYRTFRPYGGLAGYIQLRRLERVRRALGDPRDERPFATIALDSGFESSSHCSRLFTDRFGVRPGAYRQMMALDTDTDDPRIAMRMWQAEVS